MLPWETVDHTPVPDGGDLVLARRGDEWAIRVGGRVLMSSRSHGSERALAELALAAVEKPRTVMLGGLGLGYSLRALLDLLPAESRVVLVELSGAVVEWNRGPVAHLAGRPLDDPRVRLQVDDVAARIAEARGAYDAILLDVDNGASPIVKVANARLYGEAGVRACSAALAPGGVLAVWSAGPDDAYLARLRRHGLLASARTVPAHGKGSARHVVFLARRAPRSGPARARR
jgi:spermidine synthase